MSNNPKIIDLYSGVGGLSLGAVKAGFDLTAAVEIEKRIIDSHAKNFPNSQHVCMDIATLSGPSLRKQLKLGSSEIAGIVGGPPCQGFSTMGKREIDDTRNRLFTDFFRLVSELNPAFFLAENVPGILDSKYDSLRQHAFKLVESDYEILLPLKIVASDYGATTSRTRVFFIGTRKDLKGAGSIIQSINSLKTISNRYYVQDAIEGLPATLPKGALSYSTSWQKTSIPPANSYVNSINEIPNGIGDPTAIKIFLKDGSVSSCFNTVHSKDVITRYASLEPGQQDQVSKAIKLKLDGLCPTLRAGTDSTKGSYQAVRPIHPTKPRVITPREAARLQGFPDWFQFHETKWHSFRQIGNSVCPVVAQKVLSAIKATVHL